MNLNVKAGMGVIALVMIAAVSSHAQTPTPEHPPVAAQQRNFGGDPVRHLNLTPEQREQIRTIREQNRTERAAVNQHVRDTNKALEEALDSDAPDQSLIEQRIQEVSVAQAAAMRIRIMTEVKIRQVLTAEQRLMLKEMRRSVHQQVERRINGAGERQRRLEQRTRRLEQRRNRVRPLLRGNENQQPQ